MLTEMNPEEFDAWPDESLPLLGVKSCDNGEKAWLFTRAPQPRQKTAASSALIAFGWRRLQGIGGTDERFPAEMSSKR